MSLNAAELPRDYRWNFATLLLNDVCAALALTFVNVSSVMPAFVGQLTTSAMTVGLVGTVFRAGLLLPQIAVARLISDRPHKKPYLLAGTAGKIFFGIIILALWAGLANYPSAMLALFFVCLGLSTAGDGVTSVARFDILARAIPPRRRGRLIGISQFISGSAGIGIGTFVGWSLQHLDFPWSYAILFSLAGAAYVPAILALVLLREPEPQAVSPHVQKELQDRGGWLRLLVRDRVFLRFMTCRILLGMMDLAVPFYVGHAENVLHLPASIIGTFVIAQAVAGAASSIALGLICERRGPRRVIQATALVATASPIFALATHLTGNQLLVMAYPIVFVILGFVNSAWMIGFFNYIVEIAPEGMRPLYLGVGNTILGTMVIVPMIGGWILERTSYTTLFGVTAAILAVSFFVSLTLGKSASETTAECAA